MASNARSSRTMRPRPFLSSFTTFSFLVVTATLFASPNVFVDARFHLGRSAPVRPPVASSSSSSSTNINTNTIREVYENESYDDARGAWYGSDTDSSNRRWTDANGQGSSPPTSLSPPEGWRFDSDWKIDVTGDGKDGKGWEYRIGGTRRRRWLRTMVLMKEDESTGTDKDESLSSLPRKRRTSLSLSAILRRVSSAIRDDFYFKGFGTNLYKSLIFPTSFGATLKCPLTSNFNFMETRPSLPILSSAGGCFVSRDNFTVVGYLSMSMPMELVRYCALKILKFVRALCWLAWHGIVEPLTDAYRNEEKVENDRSSSTTSVAATVSSIMSSPSIQYSANVQERCGVSLSWRVSTKRGYEFRVSYYHFYQPTLERLFLRRSRSPLSKWIKERTGSVGISTSGPIPDDPGLSCSAFLSLTGFYLPVRRWLSLDLNERERVTVIEGGESGDAGTGNDDRSNGGANAVVEDDDDDDTIDSDETKRKKKRDERTKGPASNAKIKTERRRNEEKNVDKRLLSSSSGRK